MWTPGYYEVVVRQDERGVLLAPEPKTLHLIAGQPITLVASFWRWDTTLTPPSFQPYILGNPYGLRWVAKRTVEDDDAAALWNALGTFQTIAPYAADQVGRIDVGAPFTQAAVDQAYTELIVYHLSTLEPRLCLPFNITLTPKGKIFADDL